MCPDKSKDAYLVTVLSWNIEGAKRGASSLSHFVKSHQPALLFLSEPQLFQCDSSLALEPVLGNYCHHLNSEDSYYPELALESRKAKGGTLCIWHSALDPFITILPTTSPAVLPLLLSIPGLTPSAHIGTIEPKLTKLTDFNPSTFGLARTPNFFTKI